MIESGNIVMLRGERTALQGVVLLPEGYTSKDIAIAPIEPSFLLGNGWVADGYAFRYGDKAYSNATLHQISDEWELSIDNGTYLFRGWIRGVHELQNIMAICGMKESWKL